MKYIVKRAHQGDKWYEEGDKRDAAESDVAHLVKAGTLAKAGPAVKNCAFRGDPVGDSDLIRSPIPI